MNIVMKYIFLIIAAGFLLAGCSKEVWTAHYLKTTDDRIYSSMEFTTAQACSNWMAQEREKERINPIGRYSFECGSNCELSETFLIYKCDKTFDN